jgi:hypothetical protein
MLKHHLLPLLIIILLAGLLTLVLGDWLREAMVTPLLYTIWVGRLIFDSIPQAAIWGLFLLFSLLLAAKSLLKTRPPASKVIIPEPPSAQRIGFWLNSLRRVEQDIYYRWQLAQHLHKLAIDTLANDQRISPKEARQRLAQGALNLPPDMQAYLQAGMTSFSYFSVNKRRFWLKKESAPASLTLDPARLIAYLEDKIEYHPN